MKLKVAILSAIAVVSLVCAAWYYQANYAENLFSIRIPQWVAGGGPVSYSVTIHNSQIKPYGTVWKGQAGPGCRSSFPIYTEKDLKNYLKRFKRRSLPIKPELTDVWITNTATLGTNSHWIIHGVTLTDTNRR